MCRKCTCEMNLEHAINELEIWIMFEEFKDGVTDLSRSYRRLCEDITGMTGMYVPPGENWYGKTETEAG